MNLPLTQKIVLAFGMELSEWPQLWPYGPEPVKQAHRDFMSLLAQPSGSVDYSVEWIHNALDEWLMSSDRDMLSSVQQAVCGCALLELFANPSSITRVAPGIISALVTIVPQLKTWPPEALTALLQISRRLRDSDSIEHLDAFEDAVLLAAEYCIDKLCANVCDNSVMRCAIWVIQDEELETEGPLYLQALAEQIEHVPSVPEDIRASLVPPR